MLIICCTPLQVLVAEAMLEAEDVRRFKLIYYTWIDNAKHRKYYERLAARADASEYIHLNSRFPVHFFYFLRAFRRLSAKDISEIAFAAIDNFYIQYAIKRYQYQEIITFDDGVANVVKSSAYFNLIKRSNFHSIFGKVVRGDVNESWIRRKARRHYTIYPGIENIVERSRLHSVTINGFKKNSGENPSTQSSLRVFLGQPVVDIRDDELKRNYIEMVRSFDIDEYIPHPREFDLDGLPKITESNLIAEEYILDRMSEYGEVTIYSLFSTVLLNIDHQRLRKIVVVYPSVAERIKEIYPLFRERGCEFFELNSSWSAMVVPPQSQLDQK